eukprot:CAMPEP_0174236364 /NCGR_PEP_ID=MMETSP0417-20130205/5516_1 /TAXON_ID=242541 /ORGANISM="Mayorella sp, Strain BSH-02190019" /LENGTH=528 /DNA_ID=CAMNT_0015314993 /DNA_START=12 /DNA_END=1594 /DNA_ORIENTATION=-
MSSFLQPSIILLKEGTDDSQGKPQLISNINACTAVVDIVKTTLGPRGMDKLIYQGQQSTISNDGATVMKLLDIVHPAARVLVDIAKSQDAEVGDGTTSVVVLAGQFLREAKQFVEDGVHPQVVVQGFRQACDIAKAHIRRIAVSVDKADDESTRQMLQRCAATTLNSKLIAHKREFFAKMVVDAVMRLEDDLPLDMIGIKQETGGSMEDSMLIDGVAFKKTFSYAGFEQQPKRFEHPKVICLNVELELKAERDNAELEVRSTEEYQRMVDAEWKIIFDKLEAIASTGAKVVLSRLAIGDLGTQYFADRNIFCAGRVDEADLRRVEKATGAKVQTSVSHLSAGVLGSCALFEERQVGRERYNLLTGCEAARTATVILRGGGQHFTEEAERSLHDAIMIVRRARKHQEVVAGGGATEMEVARELKDAALSIQGKQQAIMLAFARALEVIPRQVADNAGLDSIDILNKLRQRHASAENRWYGVDIVTGGVCDTMASFVWEPALVKLNSITAATEAACLILSIDETIRHPQA